MSDNDKASTFAMSLKSLAGGCWGLWLALPSALLVELPSELLAELPSELLAETLAEFIAEFPSEVLLSEIWSVWFDDFDEKDISQHQQFELYPTGLCTD